MNCSTCGDVEHQPIPEDEAHCDCSSRLELVVRSRKGEPIDMDLGECSCACHCAGGVSPLDHHFATCADSNCEVCR